jgi:hypothetical protein
MPGSPTAAAATASPPALRSGLPATVPALRPGARTTDPERVSSALHHGHEHMHHIAGQSPDGTPGNPLRRNAAGSARTIG